LSVRVSAKEISSPAGHTKQLFHNSTKAIFVLENIFYGQNLIKPFLKPGFFFKFEIGVGQIAWSCGLCYQSLMMNDYAALSE
jgi:hypothetical protein